MESSVVDNHETMGVLPRQETHWTDALVRWTAANHNLTDGDDDNNNDNNDDDHGDDDSRHDTTPFQPNPSQLFSRSFPFNDDDDGTNSIMIDIHLQGYEEQSDTIYVSTGLTLWRSSELLCEYLSREGLHRLQQLRRNCHKQPPPQQQRSQDNDTSSLQILELGSGLGLVGIFLQKLLLVLPLSPLGTEHYHHKQQDSIILTDGDTNALSLLRLNVQTNILSGRVPESSSRSIPRITVEQLIWGRVTTESFIQQRQLLHNPRFDLLLAADAIYVLANVKPLMETVEALLQKPGGEFWFSYCRRRQVSVQIQHVLTEAAVIGLDYELVLEDDDILIYIFRWKLPLPESTLV